MTLISYKFIFRDLSIPRSASGGAEPPPDTRRRNRNPPPKKHDVFALFSGRNIHLSSDIKESHYILHFHEGQVMMVYI